MVTPKSTPLMGEGFISIGKGILLDLLTSNMSDDFTIELSSNLNYDGMVVYISIHEQEIAIFNYDKGIEIIGIKSLPIYTNTKTLSIPLDKLLIALEKAKSILKKCAEEDKTRDNF